MIAAADAEGRLPVPDGLFSEIFPFAPGLAAVPLEPPRELPARFGADPASCHSCADRDEGIWLDEHWRLARVTGAGVPLLLMLHTRDHFDLADLPDDLAGELGVLTVHVVRAVEALPHVQRAHVTRWGDGGAHLHVWFWARPAGQAQLRGSCLPLWESLLPEYPAEIADADAAVVAEALVASYGGRVG